MISNLLAAYLFTSKYTAETTGSNSNTIDMYIYTYKRSYIEWCVHQYIHTYGDGKRGEEKLMIPERIPLVDKYHCSDGCSSCLSHDVNAYRQRDRDQHNWKSDEEWHIRLHRWYCSVDGKTMVWCRRTNTWNQMVSCFCFVFVETSKTPWERQCQKMFYCHMIIWIIGRSCDDILAKRQVGSFWTPSGDHQKKCLPPRGREEK